MKKIINLIATFILLLLPINALAFGSIKPNSSSITMNVGDSKSFTINATNAVGRVDIVSSNSSIATVNVSNKWLDNDSVVVTVKGLSEGTANVVVKLSDAATYDEEELSGSYTIKVLVNGKNSSNTNSNSNSASRPNNTTNKSNNTKLKSLTVKGYELNENYELTVSNSVTEIELEGATEDSKASITGIGKKQLEIGINSFEIIVKAESGSKKTYIVKITRKDGFYLADIDDVLKDDNASIIINDENKITKEVLKKIKDNKKIVNLNNYDEDKNLIYTWIINGSTIEEELEFNPNVSFTSKYIEEIGSISNYADGFYANFAHSGNLPEGTKIKIYVGDKFSDNSVVNIYNYNEKENTLIPITNNINIENGYVEFDIEHCSEYFITKANVNLTNSSNFNIFTIVSIIELIIIILIIVLDVLKLNPLLKLQKN